MIFLIFYPNLENISFYDKVESPIFGFFEFNDSYYVGINTLIETQVHKLALRLEVREMLLVEFKD